MPMLSAAYTSVRRHASLPRTGFTRIFPARSICKSKPADGTTYHQPLPFPKEAVIQSGIPYQAVFVSQSDGLLTSILLAHVADLSSSGVQTLSMILSTTSDPQPQEVLANLAVTADFALRSDPRGDPVTLTLDHPVSLQHGITYYLQIQTTGGVLTLIGSAVANETDYDYPLPFRTASYDAFGGIYRGDLNLQVYWDDNADKMARFQSVLDQADYIFIPTNHQYAQITRLPERYPLTTEYYRQLVGCPADKNIIWCYRVAEPGMFHGNLGFDLVATFESYPTIGPLVINDQTAEEAFTFYDHPKVLIFKKNADYTPAIVQTILGKVDYSHAIHLTPGQADTYKSLMLPADQLAVQQAGGTWSDLFRSRMPSITVILLLVWCSGIWSSLPSGLLSTRWCGRLSLVSPITVTRWRGSSACCSGRGWPGWPVRLDFRTAS